MTSSCDELENTNHPTPDITGLPTQGLTHLDHSLRIPRIWLLVAQMWPQLLPTGSLARGVLLRVPVSSLASLLFILGAPPLCLAWQPSSRLGV